MSYSLKNNFLRKVIEQKDINLYGKLKGWNVCNKFGLQSYGDVYILSDYITCNINELLKIFGDEPLLCRPDAPFGLGNKLIRGRDIKISDLNSYFDEVKKCNREAVVLVSKHPSILLTGRYIPRYKTNGSFMIVFEKGYRILIEYVGPGFDVGDISRGKTVHSSIEVPWENIYESNKNNYKNARLIQENYFQISDQQYIISRKRRIDELVNELNDGLEENLEKLIPIEKPVLSFKLFEKVYNECINKIIYNEKSISNNYFGLMINLYDDKLCVFEVWDIKRSVMVT